MGVGKGRVNRMEGLMTVVVMALVVLGLCTGSVEGASTLLMSGACKAEVNGVYEPVAKTASGRWWFLGESGISLY